MKKKVIFDNYFFATELLLTVLYIQVEDKKLGLATWTFRKRGSAKLDYFADIVGPKGRSHASF